MKKLIISILIVTMVMVFAGGTVQGKETVVWWHHQALDQPQGRLFQKYMEEFEAKNPDIDVVMEAIPHTQYITKLPTAIAVGEAPDIFGLSYRQLHTYY